MACYLSYSGHGGQTFVDEDDCDEESSLHSPDTFDAEPKFLLQKDVTMNELRNGNYNIIYTHPECLFKSPEIACMIRSKTYRENLCGVVVDEAHMVLEWGKEFRVKFNQLGELTSLHPDVAHLALTATAKPETISIISKTLLYKYPKIVAVNPDRPNIFIDKAIRPPNLRKIEKYNSFIHPLAQQLKEELDTFPVTLAYVESLEALGYCYQFVVKLLREKQYNGKTMIPENRIVAQYHSDYTANMKSHILKDLTQSSPTIRLVLGTVSIGMGLNAPSIERVIHMRPPFNLENCIQEIGRAGRLGQKSCASLFLITVT